jgi:PleD family two-component response regulator
MVSKKRLTALSELSPGDKIEQLDNVGLQEYTEKMNRFIDHYPTLERSIKDALAARDTGTISKDLLAIWDMLDKLYAERLAKVGFALLNSAKETPAEKLEADLTAFFTDASALSIALQMVQQVVEYGTPEAVEKREYDILAVDDAAFFLGALKSFLAGTEYKVTCLTSGVTALRYLAAHTPDLFILDIEMPEMDGYTLASKIKAMGFQAPIIFLTGNASKEYVAKAIKVGGVDFIVKPIDKARVLAKLKQHL